FDGIPVRLVDTAGLRDAPAGVSANGDADSADGAHMIERLGIARTRREIESADVVVWVLDASGPWSDAHARIRDVLGARPRIVTLNKSDLPRRLAAPAFAGAAIAVSARTGAGVPALRASLGAAARGEGTNGGEYGDASRALVTNVRHIDALRRAR